MQKYLKLIKNNSNFKIRYAKIEDLHFTLKLHNQNVLKDKFFSKEKVGLKDHKIWFKNKINEKMLFICTFKDKIGYVRYDFINKKNPLDEIPGIGLKRKKALLNFFGSARSVGQAKVDELMAVDGISQNTANSIFHWFH